MATLDDAATGSEALGAAPPARSYRAVLARDPRVDATGLRCRVDGVERRLAWEEVWFAAAAEVGEPEGVRTIVFDLVVGQDAGGWRALRLDADPGPDAEEIARAIHGALPRDRRGASIRSLAWDGVASQWFADLDGFAEAVAGAVERLCR